MASLPEKEEGRHRWYLSAVYPLEPSEAAAIAGGAAFVCDDDRFVIVRVVMCCDYYDLFDDVKAIACPADAAESTQGANQ